MGFWPVVLNVLRNSDVVLLLVDARMPELTRNSEIIKKIEMSNAKRLLLVFNKSDLISRKEIEKLKKEYPKAFFVSAAKKIGVGKLLKSNQHKFKNYYGNKSKCSFKIQYSRQML